MTGALSITAAAREAGDLPCMFTRERMYTFAECAAAVIERRPAEVVVARPEAATVFALYAALETRRPIALVQPSLGVDVPALPPDAALVLYTSGSTAAPRGVVHTRESLAAAAAAHPFAWRDDDRWLLCLSLAHAGGAAIAIRCLAARKPIILHEGDFDATRIADLAYARAATLASLVPTQLDALLAHAFAPRAVLLGGAAATPALLARAHTAGVPTHETYGLTETFGQVATARAPGEPLRPLAGVELAAGTRAAPARLLVRGPMLAARYLDDTPIAPAFATNDLGFVEHGELHVVGRADEVIISGGENVHPAAVEAMLAATPGVRAAVVFGVRDARWGQLVAAALAIDDTFDVRVASARWHAALPAHARPRLLATRPALPLLPNGKLDRRAAAALTVDPLDYCAP